MNWKWGDFKILILILSIILVSLIFVLLFPNFFDKVTGRLTEACTDFDDGINYGTYGTACVASKCSKDTCINSTRLKEAYCRLGTTVAFRLHDCPVACEGGVCVASAATEVTVSEPSYKSPDAENIGLVFPIEPTEKEFDGYIVELKDEPLVVEKEKIEDLNLAVSSVNRNLQIAENELEYDRENFKRSALIKLEKSSIVTGDAIGDSDALRVLEEYDKTFNGLALNITTEEAEKIKKLSGVKAVYPNYKFDILLTDSVPLTNTDDVWKLDVDGGNCAETGKLCLTGQGIEIGILDTGVDYTHSDLGGCLGVSCKVIGGWDFVNNDDNPIDDHGHGTHVAATAAGNGILKGVAPDAKIYAYKVLNNYGSGYETDIIAAIERSVDPNKDGDFSDHLDIISLSLGSGGNPDDIISKAIDNAVSAGIVAVVAAGNSGPGENTIGSPGTARKAITVGASYKSDTIGYFSSRGNVKWNDSAGNIKYLIKPDVVAPGVSICAAEWDSVWSNYKCLDDNHVSISGTSMATPHVSGAVALLLQKHLDWTPEEIKMVLRNTAANLNEPINVQGYGRIDVLNALNFNGIPSIAQIETGGVVSGTIDIAGTAKGRDFKKYILYYGAGKEPSVWTELTNSITPVENEILYPNFDVSSLGEGIYYLKLTVENNLSGISEDRNLIEVNDTQTISPPPVSPILPCENTQTSCGEPGTCANCDTLPDVIACEGNNLSKYDYSCMGNKCTQNTLPFSTTDCGTTPASQTSCAVFFLRLTKVHKGKGCSNGMCYDYGWRKQYRFCWCRGGRCR